MSWDLLVLTAGRPSSSDLDEALPKATRRAADMDGDGNLVVERQVRGEWEAAFTMDGPLVVEAEDVDPTLWQAVVAPVCLIEVNVPYGAPNTVRQLALRVCRHLAKAKHGAVYDPQSGSVVHPRSGRRPAPSVIQQDPTTVRLSYVAAPQHLAHAGAELLGAMRRWMPEALPDRFGPFEPYQHRRESDDGEFLAMWSAEARGHGSLSWKASRPCVGGGASWTPPSAYSQIGGVAAGSLYIEFLGSPFVTEDDQWREALVRFFQGVATAVDAPYGRATWDEAPVGGLRAADLYKGDRPPGLCWKGRWLGVPRHPAWLHWLGDFYGSGSVDDSLIRTGDLPGQMGESALPEVAEGHFRRQVDPERRTGSPTWVERLLRDTEFEVAPLLPDLP